MHLRISLMFDFVSGDSPMAMARGDFNRDGRDDLVVVNEQDNTLGVYLLYFTC